MLFLEYFLVALLPDCARLRARFFHGLFPYLVEYWIYFTSCNHMNTEMHIVE